MCSWWTADLISDAFDSHPIQVCGNLKHLMAKSWFGPLLLLRTRGSIQLADWMKALAITPPTPPPGGGGSWLLGRNGMFLETRPKKISSYLPTKMCMEPQASWGVSFEVGGWCLVVAADGHDQPFIHAASEGRCDVHIQQLH